MDLVKAISAPSPALGTGSGPTGLVAAQQPPAWWEMAHLLWNVSGGKSSSADLVHSKYSAMYKNVHRNFMPNVKKVI